MLVSMARWLLPRTTLTSNMASTMNGSERQPQGSNTMNGAAMKFSRSMYVMGLMVVSSILLIAYFLKQEPNLMLQFSHLHGIVHGQQSSSGVLPTSNGTRQETGQARGKAGLRLGGQTDDQMQTSDNWPYFSKNYFPKPIPKSPFHPDFRITWNYNTTEFLQRPDVKGQPEKIITWRVKTRYLPPLPEPVRLRFCPEMPCLMTTNQSFQNQSAALIWAGQIMRDPEPPLRSHPDQVFVFHQHEPQSPDWIRLPSFRKPAWKSAFNWTMDYRLDSDFVEFYGILAKRQTPLVKNYTDIVAKKTKLAAWIVSNCKTQSRREEYVRLLQQYIPVDVYGGCGPFKCPRSKDDACFEMISTQYKFYLSFESSLCKDYISEKFFRYFGGDMVLVVRGNNDYKLHAPAGILINTGDYSSIKALADHLLHLNSHPEDYINILKAKDAYQPVYEEYPIRDKDGNIQYMTYHYEAVPFCDMCRRLWDLDKYRKTIPDIAEWFDKGNCYGPSDLH